MVNATTLYRTRVKGLVYRHLEISPDIGIPYYPPAMAPTIRSGSVPSAPSRLKRVSGDSCERSSEQPKKRMKGRRCWVVWAGIVPRRVGHELSRRSSTES